MRLTLTIAAFWLVQTPTATPTNSITLFPRSGLVQLYYKTFIVGPFFLRTAQRRRACDMHCHKGTKHFIIRAIRYSMQCEQYDTTTVSLQDGAPSHIKTEKCPQKTSFRYFRKHPKECDGHAEDHTGVEDFHCFYQQWEQRLHRCIAT
ncbi:hypothetical protein TNCV_1518131 [Trichonephila clavipes]|nr:hypothetical protein TNCV_1518131 [Trichonephila clavipes]